MDEDDDKESNTQNLRRRTEQDAADLAAESDSDDDREDGADAEERRLRRRIQSVMGNDRGRELAKKIMNDLDEKSTRRVQRLRPDQRNSGKPDRREKRAHPSVAEAYSPPRLTAVAL